MSAVNLDSTSPTAEATRRIREVVRSMFELGELHAGLLRADYHEASRHAVPSLMLAGAALVTALASLPLLLLGLAVCINRYTPLELWASLLIVSGVFIAISALIAWRALKQALSALKAFERSQAELKLNLAWFKSLM